MLLTIYQYCISVMQPIYCSPFVFLSVWLTRACGSKMDSHKSCSLV